MRTPAAIPTTYAGTNFRSRLEARYAILFDAVRWRWSYEAVDGRGRIPDFLLDFWHPLLLEVKPAATLAEISAERRSLIEACDDWLCADHEVRLRELDARDDVESGTDLDEIDALVHAITCVRDLRVNPPGGRRALVAGSQLHGASLRSPGGEVDIITYTLDGRHGFAHCPGCPVVGLVDWEAPARCLACGHVDPRMSKIRPVRADAIIGVWREAGTKAQWQPPR